MASKTISGPEEIYEMLQRLKLPNEYFGDVLKKLIDDGDVEIVNGNRSDGRYLDRRSHSFAKATWFPEKVEEEVRDPHANKKAELVEAGLRYPGQPGPAQSPGIWDIH
jgi:predicted CopG family antitoxin